MISLFIAIPAILIFVLSLLIGLKRGAKKSIIRFACLLLSLFIAIPVATTIAKALSDVVGELIFSLLESVPETAELILASPTLAVAPSLLAGVISAPIIFVFVFIILSLLFFIVGKIVSTLTAKLGDFNSKTVSRLVGVGVSALCAIVIIVALYAPIVGYLGIASDTLEKLEETAPDYASSVPELAQDALYEGANSPAVKISGALGGKALFNGLSSGKLDGERITLAHEIDALTDAVFCAPALIETDIEHYGDKQSAAIKNIAEAIPESELLVKILPELISSLSRAWLNGEDFAGVAKPELDATVAPLVDKLLLAFSTSDSTNIADDLATVGDLLCILIDNGFFANLGDTDALIEKFSNPDFASALIKAIGEGRSKDRLSFLIPEITNLGLSIVYSSLGIPTTNEEVNTSFVGDVAVAVDSVSSLSFEEMLAALSPEIRKIADNYALPVDESELDAITYGLAYDFCGVETVTEADIDTFFLTYAAYITSEEGGITSLPVTVNTVRFIIDTGEEQEVTDGMMVTFTLTSGLDAVNTDGVYAGTILSASENSITLAKGKVTGAMLAAQLAKGVKASELPEGTLDEEKRESYEKTEQKHSDTPKEPKLYTKSDDEDGAHKLNTRIPTQEEMVWSGDGLDESSYDKLAEVVATAASVVATTDLNSVDLMSVASSIGSVLDGIAEISDEMKQISDNMVKSALITVKDNALTGVSTSAILDIAEGIISVVSKEKSEGETPVGPAPSTPTVTTAPVVTTVAPVVTDTPDAPVTTAPVTTAGSGYGDVFGAAGELLGYVSVLGSSTATPAEKQDTLGSLIIGIDKTKAELLFHVINYDLITSIGVPSEYAGSAVLGIKEMFGTLSVQESITDADKTALKLLFNILLYSTHSGGSNLFDIGEEASVLGTTASYFVDTIEDSKAVATATATILNSNGAIAGQLSEADKVELKAAANDCTHESLRRALLNVCQ